MQTLADKYTVLYYGGFENWEIVAEDLTFDELNTFFVYTLIPVKDLAVIKGTWLSYEDIKTLCEEAKKENK